jgi:protein associated with RNAse G/E
VITVIKRNAAGRETWRYDGVLMERSETFVRLEARFNRDDLPFQDTVFRRNDRFVETFYTDRWYNVFEIHDCEGDRIKGWYCNVGRPLVWEAPQVVSYVDLALDAWVSAAGQLTFLDWDDYARLKLDAPTRRQVRGALYELLAFHESKKPPA